MKNIHTHKAVGLSILLLTFMFNVSHGNAQIPSQTKADFQFEDSQPHDLKDFDKLSVSFGEQHGDNLVDLERNVLELKEIVYQMLLNYVSEEDR